MVLLAYHLYIIRNKEKPENVGFEPFLRWARTIDWTMADIYIVRYAHSQMMTRPPVEKLLPDKPPMPQG
jgi:hypothetical protein